MNALIAARGLEKTYRMGEETVHALDTVSFDVQAGENLAVIGPSGSGKSTLMNLIGALDRPTGGSLVVDSADLGALTDEEAATFRNRTIGFVFQSFNLLARSTAQANVELPLIYAGWAPERRRVRAQELLSQVGLEERMRHKPSELSGGQQQRVAIARSLAVGPAILLADEPTGALDTNTGKEILALFATLNTQGVTIVVVTHDLEVAAASRRVIEMRDGRIVRDGAPEKAA
jgi:putative ABC transport system ATP-binding protein